jgi:hypothetical protein
VVQPYGSGEESSLLFRVRPRANPSRTRAPPALWEAKKAGVAKAVPLQVRGYCGKEWNCLIGRRLDTGEESACYRL